MTIGLFGLDQLRGPLLTERSGKSLEFGRRLVGQTLFKKCEDCEPRITRIARIGGDEISRD